MVSKRKLFALHAKQAFIAVEIENTINYQELSIKLTYYLSITAQAHGQLKAALDLYHVLKLVLTPWLHEPLDPASRALGLGQLDRGSRSADSGQ